MHHADQLGVYESSSVGMMLECSHSKFLTRAVFMHRGDKEHDPLMHYVAWKGLCYTLMLSYRTTYGGSGWSRLGEVISRGGKVGRHGEIWRGGRTRSEERQSDHCYNPSAWLCLQWSSTHTGVCAGARCTTNYLHTTISILPHGEDMIMLNDLIQICFYCEV